MKYLLAVDSSEHSWSAARYLADSVKETDSVRVLLCAKNFQPKDENLVQEVAALFVNRLGSAKVEGHVEPRNDAAKAIVEYANVHEVDVIVMGARGMNAMKRAVVGSVSSNVLHHATQSMLVVHRYKMHGAPGSYMLCTDGSEESAKAAHMLASMITRDDHVVLWTCYIPPPVMVSTGRMIMPNPRYRKALQEGHTSSRSVLEGVRDALLRNADLDPDNVLLESVATSNGAEAALSFAKHNSVRTIVCGTHGRGAVDRFMLGSFSTALVHDAKDVAILIVR